MNEAFSRTELLLGSEAMERLAASHVLLFGVGGVGSFAAEALVRSGIGALTLVDHDTVSRSNLNRQLHATVNTIDRLKVEVMRERLLSINPDCEIRAVAHFYLPDSDGGIFDRRYDYVIDAIDTVSAKLSVIETALKNKIPVISCMGTGNKLDPSRLTVADLAETSVCPLCRVMRSELRKRGIEHVPVVYSPEPPIRTGVCDTGGRHIPGSTAFVPPAAGLLLASEVVLELSQSSR